MAKLSTEYRKTLQQHTTAMLQALTPFAQVNPEVIAGIPTTRQIFVTDGINTAGTDLTPKMFLEAAKWIRKETHKQKQTIDFLLQKNICSLHNTLKPFANFNLNEHYKQIQNKQTIILMLSYEGKPINSFLITNNFLQAAELYEQVQSLIINNK